MNSRFELQPTLTGSLIHVRPLVKSDLEQLYQVASDPLIWEQHPQKDRFREKIFHDFFEQALNSRGALVIAKAESMQIIGSSRYYDFDESESCIVIGYTFLGREYWGGDFNKELKRLMLNHAFQFVDRVHFHIGECNVRSQRAIERIGAHLVNRTNIPAPNGRQNVRLIYQISKADWI